MTISDIHTHLFPPSHGQLLLWNVDELLTYHYLVAELFTIAPRELTYEKFWSLSKREQADLVWEHVFGKRGPLSEACRGVITTLNALGLDIADRDLGSIRQWFDQQDEEDYVQKVLSIANLDYVIMTNNPFNAEEAGYWKQDLPKPENFKTALRIDPLVVSWDDAVAQMKSEGYDVTGESNDKTFDQARRFLNDWADKLDPVYMAASLPPDFHYPSGEMHTQVFDRILVPFAQERGLPIAMMIGVRKQVNPGLGDGGDAVGVSDITAVQHLLQKYDDLKLIVTTLSRVDQHELTVLARKFGRLHIEGCWWFLNNPSIIAEMTRLRLELLGTAFTAQHSDARVLDQLIYKWSHTRDILAEVLADKYTDLFNAGWRPTQEEISRDVRNLLGGSFETFCAK